MKLCDGILHNDSETESFPFQNEKKKAQKYFKNTKLNQDSRSTTLGLWQRSKNKCGN